MSRRLLFLAAGCLILTPGCSSSSAEDADGKSAHSHGPTAAPSPTGTVTIALGDGTDLTFSPGVSREIPVTVSPPAVYTVRFSLVGDVDDAYLDKSEAETDASGNTSVTLTPPSSPVVFKLHASVAGASADLTASAASERTTLDVVPAYAGGRAISKWIATVDTNQKCNPLASVPPSDGPLTGEADEGQALSVENVPLGAPLRVTVRAGQFAGGCTQVPAFVAGQRHSVSVTVIDRPLQMNAVKIPVALGIDQNATWSAAWTALATTMASSAVGGASDDASALLDAMGVATPYLSQDAFIYGRGLHDWDDRVSDVLGAHATTAIRDALTRWIAAGLPALSEAAIRGTLTSPAVGTGTGVLTVTSVGGATPSDTGISSVVGLTWTSAAADQVLFGATASWQPSYLAAALAANAAAKEVTAATSVSDALSKTLTCKDIGTELGRDAADVPFLSCDTSCLASRCESALGAMWKKAQAAAIGHAAVHIAASGSASIDDSAHPVGFMGTWVGDASLGGAATHLTGSANGGPAAAKPR
ncbi:MAG TPA: hypothetical protein VHU80_01935 [Polyangiaceae bacterium]|nr:hypothetical protein [Polyangiaceae bacterium]